MSWDILPKGNLQYFLQKLKGKLDSKVDAVSGKGLSTNDYTTTEKNKLAGIEAGAQVNPTIDSALSDSSVNAVQNKVVKAALDGKAGREEIPTVNDNTITIQLNGTTIESFTLNQTTNETINIQVTKSSVGLGDVPNVTTNDQTPTFTQASTRTNIASGEKLSVIFGKIMKWFADLKTVAFSGSYSDLSDTPSTDSLLTALPTWTATPTDDTYLLRRDTGGAANYGQVKFSSIWSYINSKVSAAGYTKNAGTVTQVKVGSAAYNPSSGVVSLPAYPTSVNYATSAGSAGTATSAGSAAKGTNNKFETTFLTLGSNGNEPSVTIYNSVSGDGTLKVGINPNDTAMGSSGRNLYLPIGSMYSSNQATLATVEYLNSNLVTGTITEVSGVNYTHKRITKHFRTVFLELRAAIAVTSKGWKIIGTIADSSMRPVNQIDINVTDNNAPTSPLNCQIRIATNGDIAIYSFKTSGGYSPYIDFTYLV